ncbi:DctP family TRAP transporter solute-binding subunit [uncultured Cohaesibacter sp.]|uniref:DctP family TRAP transporter solute-binding subunit n=1 Tax=uncultured Cohaesibacter sp. TaxID=1002546 RepID=UPI00292F46E4|nr:DctP family TRAP transporter solute-binding subunit [uncultured Cohaesibacter sp.]
MTLRIKSLICATALMVTAGTACADMGKLNIRMSNGLTADHPIGTGVEVMNACLKNGSDGKIKVTPYWSHALGSETEAGQALRAGLQEMMIEPPSALFGIEPSLGVFDLPFLFSDETAVDAALDGDFGKFIAKKMDPQGFVVLGFWEHGFRHITNSRKPIQSLDDLKGLRIRVMQNKIFLDTFDALGANAIPMAWGELFAALETKAVDAEENPIAVIDSAKFYEVQDYLSLTGHVYAPLMVAYSKALWEKLSGEEQALIQSCVDEGKQAERKELRGRTADTIEKLSKSGMKVNKLSPEALAEMRKATAGVYKANAEVIGQDTLDALDAALKK